jgi:hypothetical protein
MMKKISFYIIEKNMIDILLLVVFSLILLILLAMFVTYMNQQYYRRHRSRPFVGGCAGTRYGCCPNGVTSCVDNDCSNCSGSNKPMCAESRYGCCPDGVTARNRWNTNCK